MLDTVRSVAAAAFLIQDLDPVAKPPLKVSALEKIAAVAALAVLTQRPGSGDHIFLVWLAFELGVRARSRKVQYAVYGLTLLAVLVVQEYWFTAVLSSVLYETGGVVRRRMDHGR